MNGYQPKPPANDYQLKLPTSGSNITKIDKEVKHKVVRADNLMYDGCEPHWKCIYCAANLQIGERGMKMRTLWEKIVSYPDKLMYYDKDKNEQDTITVTYEMDDFFNDRAEKTVLNYEVDFDRSVLWIEFDSGKREKEE